MKIQIKKVNDKAKLPKKAKEGDAGYDVFSIENVVIHPKEIKLVKTGIAMAIPKGFYVKVCPKSGLALKGLDVLAGTIDSGFRDQVGLVLINFSQEPIAIAEGEKAAQFIFRKHYDPKFEEVLELPESERGKGGYGSTGKK